MKEKLKSIFVLLFGVMLTVSLTALPGSALDQPFMKQARMDLQSARGNLQRATADKGGHRVKALELVASAISEVNEGIQFDRRNSEPNFDDFSVSGEFNAAATPDQKYMERAKDNLKDALKDLDKATADKGGHRAKAMDLVRDAIDEVDKGIDYDRKN